ncbi:MAG: hypothetical protein UU81_C0002G0036 [Microgenomates group bacterium GW2011_GWC1_41_8]|uniref:Uncharacterized protein n=3 Tax=Candidatus Roizmaniibacteriota TaxID=1752723 RepID=A0A0G0X6D5_9BACT|nr:MAG: hypothetical protein UT85_C0001G0018 [Candidatus Levybacteria bacterium GW2011_GWA2_40_16]KKR72586.1 MAG: hypothetical protein UU14_C0004G0017 [Candidatus Roizmanbacteria bacterium GW2011_GWB1_40_7]KKR95027.1 MAG: hypothetical protein UU41_C0001G0017 [Candidatus Roizmanbacteria bacterium GW2011_GWA1_41_13]KKS20604.1 MAG: hypothetical protein UU78_C0058G0002 [Candidatus Roizmanbacteria bacterium GW2011_GWC2_41_7]KKS24781.1 MAG: hypothetical protein UU81_C0002G0036 [Microgenomates group b
MKKNILVVLSTIIVITLFSGQLIVSNRLATMGAALTEMEVQTDELLKENEELSHQIASDSSLMVVSNRAAERGFSSATVRYLERPAFAYQP